MKKFFILLKTSFTITFNPKKMFFRQNKPISKTRSITYAVLTLFFIVYFLGLSTMMFYYLGEQLSAIGFIDLLIYIAILMYTVLIFVITLFSAQGYLFKSKDLQLLLSIPVTHFSVLLSKFSLLYVYELMFSAIILGPAFYFYLYFTSVSAFGIIGFIVCFLASPFIPLAIGSLLSYFVGLLTRRLRKKNIFTILISIILLIGWFLFIQSGNAVFDYIMKHGETIKSALSRYYFPSEWLLSALKGDLFKTALFFLFSIFVVGIIFMLISAKYSDIISIMNTSGVRKKQVKQNFGEEQSSAFIAILKKELSFYFSSSNYVLNTIIGPVIMVIAAIALIFTGGDLKIMFDSPDLGDFKYLIVAAMLVLTPSISPTTSSTVSLEGKKLWIYKSIPAKTEDILKAKTAVNLIITVPAILIGALLFCIALELTVLDYILFTALGIVFALFFSLTSILINLANPKLDFDNEIVVIKQSASVFIQMLVSFVTVAVIGIVYAIINPSFYFFALSVLVLISFITAFLLKTLYTWGVQKFNQL